MGFRSPTRAVGHRLRRAVATAASSLGMSARAYRVALHALVVLLAVQSLFLAYQNRQLRAAQPSPAILAAGQTVPALALRGLDGVERKLAPGVLGRDHLLLVFTTTCQACALNQPAWRRLHEAVAGRAEVVGVSLDEVAATAAYRQARDLPFEVTVPVERADFAAALRVARVPLTVHLGGDGRVRGAWTGVLSDAVLSEIRASFTRAGTPAAS